MQRGRSTKLNTLKKSQSSQLTCLDDRPIENMERAACEAYAKEISDGSTEKAALVSLFRLGHVKHLL